MSSCKSNRAFWCPIIDFAIHTAMRRGELLSITWDMVHIDKKTITLPPEITKQIELGTFHCNQEQ
jgi:integrase